MPDTPSVNNLLPRLQRWYKSQCDGVWEHTRGIRIETLDNPGWMLTVDFTETPLAGRPFTPVERGLRGMRPVSPEWISCTVVGNEFKGACGPEKLAEVIAVFLVWAEGQ